MIYILYLNERFNMAKSEKNLQQIRFDERNRLEKLLFVQFIGKVRITPLLTEPQETDA